MMTIRQRALLVLIALAVPGCAITRRHVPLELPQSARLIEVSGSPEVAPRVQQTPSDVRTVSVTNREPSTVRWSSVTRELARTNLGQRERPIVRDLMSAPGTNSVGSDDDHFAEIACDLGEQSQSGSVDAVIVGQQEFHGASLVNSGRLG